MARLDVRLTAEGRRDLEAELARREATRQEISHRLMEARAGGNDPSENLDLRDAMDELALIEGGIGELRALLATAEPLEQGPAVGGVARLGATVRVKHADGEVATYRLVSAAEADPRRGRISVESPIGQAIVGSKKGKTVVAETPSGTQKLVVQSVE